METDELIKKLIKNLIECINESEKQNRIRKIKRTKSHPTNNTIKIQWQSVSVYQ